MLESQQQNTPPYDAVAPHTGRDGAVEAPRYEDNSLDLFDSDTFDEEFSAHPKMPWWRRRWTGIVAAVVLVALIGGVAVARARGAPKPITYSYATIAQGNLTLTVSGTGPVEASLYNLNFAASGRIAEIDVKVGQQVTAGQVLAKLDTTQLQDALNQAQIQSYIAYDQEQAALNNCATSKSPPPNCVQLAENQYAAALAQLKTAQDNLNNATLIASHAGTVTAINGSVGSTPGSGGSGSGASSSSSGGSGFIQIADSSSLQVIASINEADIGGVANGQTATFTVSAYPSDSFRATVSAVSPVGQTSSSVVTYPVTLDVDMTRLQGASLLTGMTANVTIVKARRVNVVLVPTSAVSFGRAAANTSAGGFLTRTQLASTITQAQQMRSDVLQQNPQLSQDNPTTAWVLERANNQWVVKPVVLGLGNGSTYEVLSGLNPGEQVVTAEQNGPITTSSSTTTGAGGRGAGGFGGFGGGGGGGRGGAGAGG